MAFVTDYKDTIKDLDIDNFLKELTMLSKKYKIIIGGCGCCHSPFLMRYETDGRYTYDKNAFRYGESELEWAGETIIKI